MDSKITGLSLSRANRKWHMVVYSTDDVVQRFEFDTFSQALEYAVTLRGQGQGEGETTEAVPS